MNEMTNVTTNNVSETAPTIYMEGTNFIADLTTRDDVFCSITPKTQEDKSILFKAMNNPDYRIADFINMTIQVKDVYCETVKCVNRQTGESVRAPRIVLIDNEGKGYQCVSIGMLGGLKKLFAVFGMPNEWETPLPVTIKQITKGDRSLLTFDVQL